MATIIDSLIVTLGLDASNFTAGQKQAVTHLRQTEEAAQRTAREMSSRGRQGAEFFDQMKSSALSFLGVFVGSQGLEAIIKSSTDKLAALGRQAQNIGVDVSTLDAYGMAISRAVGGNAEAARASLLTLAQQMEMFKLKGDSPLAPWLSRIGAGADDSVMTVIDKFTKFAEEHKDDIQGVNAVGLNLGLTQDMINEARRGTSQYQKDLAESRRIGVVTPDMSKAAQDFNTALVGVEQAIAHIVDTSVADWLPTFTKILKALTDWIVNNQDLAKDIFEIAAGLTALGTALGALRLVTRLLGLSGAVREAGAAFEGTAGIFGRLIPFLARLAPAAAFLYEIWPKATATEEQERDLINKGRIAHGEEPLPEPEKKPEPTTSRAGTWLRGIVGGMPEGPAKDWARQHFGSDEIAASEMNPDEKAFLKLLSEKESGGRYDVRQGGETFDDYSKHPTGIGKGGISTAAGRYQFIDETWRTQANKLGLTDFSPANQDRAALDLAKTTYRQKTGGRDLISDFASRQHDNDISQALGPVWASMPHGPQALEDMSQLSSRSQGYLDQAHTPPPTPAPQMASMTIRPAIETAITPKTSIFDGFTIPPGSLPVVSAGDRASTAAATAQAAATPAPNNNMSTEMHIGTMNVHTQATEAKGISRDIERAMADRLVTQANRGLQ